jgi:serine/threonine protein kinase
VVFKGKFRGETVAIKKIHAHALNNRGSIDEFRAEVSVLCTLRHPNILSFLGACVKAPNLMIVTEFMARGTLFDILHQSQMSVTWAMRRKMALDTCRGMRYLHESKLLHRDLKSSNLMLDNDFNCKVGDFGLTRISKGAVAAQMTGQCGTFQYMAVEVLASKPYSEKADVFSFGILLWELVARKLPYFGMQPMQVGLAVVQRGLRPTIPPTCPAPLAKLMQACWDNSPNKRPSFEQIERSLTAMPEVASAPTAPA